MSKTYYTKCGACFQKSSTAGITRFEDLTDKCEGCEYIEHTTTHRGGKDVKIAFCQAGSKKPVRNNEYSTTNENDATTLSIISLDMNFLKEVNDYYVYFRPTSSRKWPEVFHGLDKEDCRKSMPLYFENNKKGKALKRSIIDKYFKNPTNENECNNKAEEPGEVKQPVKPKKSELQGRNVTKRGIKFREYFYTAEFLKQYWKQTLVIKVVEGSPENIEVYADFSGDKFLGYIERSCQKNEPGELLKSNSNDKYVFSPPMTEPSGKKVCPFYKSHKEDKAFIECRDTINVHHADWIRPRENGELHNRYYHYTCCGSYYACALYQEQKGDKKPTCNTCPNGDMVDGSRGEKVICLISGEEKEGHNSDMVCEWHNRQYKNDSIILTESKNKCIQCEHCLKAENSFSHPAPFMCFKADHRRGADWFFNADSEACKNFKQSGKNRIYDDGCPYYGGIVSAGKSQHIKCDEKHLIPLSSGWEAVDMSNKCKTLYKYCRDYTIKELFKLGIDFGPPSSPRKDCEHLIRLFEDAEANEETCTNCKFRGSYQDYVSDDGSFYWKCNNNNDMVASNITICANYERMDIQTSMNDTDNEFNCSQEFCPFHAADDVTCLYVQERPYGEEDVEEFSKDVKMAVKDHCCKKTSVKDKYNEIVDIENKKVPRSIVEGVCLEMKEDCICFCSHNDGCSVNLMTGDALTTYIKKIEEKGGVDCNIYRDIRDREISPKGIVIDYPTYNKALELVEGSSLDEDLSFIRKKCKDIVGNYIEIGFALINIKDKKLYKERGYDNLIDCVEAELNMKKSSAYNFIKLAEQFGDPGTKRLKDEYSQYNYAQCIEMSTMTKNELHEINPNVSKRDMQKFKKSNRLENARNIIQEEQYQESTDSSNDSSNNLIEVVDYKIVDENNCLQTKDNYQDENSYNLDPKIKESQYNELLIENENYKVRINTLEQEKRDLTELVNTIDKNFNNISKKQLRNCIADFITTGQIKFEEN